MLMHKVYLSTVFQPKFQHSFIVIFLWQVDSLVIANLFSWCELKHTSEILARTQWLCHLCDRLRTTPFFC